MEWGNSWIPDVNILRMKIRSVIRPRDQRDRFTELEIKQIFHKENYIHYTKVKRKMGVVLVSSNFYIHWNEVE